MVRQIPLRHIFYPALSTLEPSVYFSSIITSQAISNVPSTVLLARFTGCVEALFYGSNIGGVGTLVGSNGEFVCLQTIHDLWQPAARALFVGFTIFNLIGLLILGLCGLLADHSLK